MKIFKKLSLVILISLSAVILVSNWEFSGTSLIAQEEGEGESLAPFVPSPMYVVEKMLELAEVTENDVVYDLGCGDGRIVVMAAEKYGARGVGVDYDIERVLEARELAKEKKVENLVKIIHQDAMTVDLSPAAVVTLYLLSRSNALLKPNLEKYLKPGSRVVSHEFNMEGWTAKKVEHVPNEYGDDEHTLYLWVIGENKPKK